MVKLRIVRLRCSTLVENLIAMVIISLIFSLAIMLYLNISKANRNRAKAICEYEIDELYKKTVVEQVYIDRKIKVSDYEINLKIEEYNNQGLIQMYCSCTDSKDNLVMDQSYLILPQ